MKKKVVVFVAMCAMVLSACGNTADTSNTSDVVVADEVESSNELEQDSSVVATSNEAIAAAYLAQLQDSIQQMEEESRAATAELDYLSPYSITTFYRIEDFNSDNVPELVVIAYGMFEDEQIYDTFKPATVLGVQIYTYAEDKVEPVYLSQSSDFSVDQEASYDYERNQFYHTIRSGGGGGYGWCDMLVYGSDGALYKDFATGDTDTVMDRVSGTIYEHVSDYDFRNPWNMECTCETESPINSNTDWINRVSDSAIYDYQKNMDCIYLKASDTSLETVLALIERGTTTAYNSEKCRYFLSNISIEQRNDGMYANGDLYIDKEYQEYIQRPNTELFQENVSYKIADGASCFMMGGAYLGSMSDLTELPVNLYGVVAVDDEYVYGILGNNAE